MRSRRAEVAMSSVRAKCAAESTLLLLLALLLLSLGSSNIHGATLTDNSTNVLSLQHFRNGITNDPTGVLNSWNSSTYHCTWEGVTCSRVHPGRITALKLPGRNLVGEISPSVGNLTSLKALDLSANGFSGLLPPLNNLHKLQTLNLSWNSLNDIIPDALTNCSNLRFLDLTKNSLTGGIPSKIGLLSNLSYLGLSKNNLTGTIPPTLGNTTHIRTISLDYNNFTGRIPYEIGDLTKLSKLALGVNSLWGAIPRSIFNLTSLQILGLDTNMLTGKSFPPNVGLPNLQELTMGDNMFDEGEIPASLGNSTNLQVIGLEKNNLTGQVPSLFGKFLKLRKLSLQGNNLEARDNGLEFFDALTNCTYLELLAVNHNRLQGVLPDSIGNLSTSMKLLVLSENGLSGLVPLSIVNLRGLTLLGLGLNNFTGTIEWVGNLTNLQGISLMGNNFIGQIPSSVGNLTRLSKLYLAENELEGTMPPGLGNIEALLVLSLSSNNLHGNIPIEFTNLSVLNQLDLSSNKLAGEIPESFDRCKNLAVIKMSKNLLTGSIPSSLGNLNSLSMLNLSYNNLSGTIPTSLSNLQLLKILDLSYNALQGQIPTNGVFENASEVSLKGNWGLCGGPRVLQMPSCTSISKRTKTRYYLIRVLIPIFGFMSLILLVYFLFLIKKMPRRTYLSSSSFGDKFFQTVSYNDLAQATRNFSEHNLIGKGSYGSVYRGKLKEHTMEVAVKVFNLEMGGAERSFLSECEALRSIQHRNLLPIITACSTVDNIGKVFKALVYEFMPNGSLDTWLHHKEEGKTPKRLGLSQRISVAVNIADALDYLHHDCGRPTVHCDLKPSNILLNDDMTALLGDFGIARFYDDSRLTSTGSISTVSVKGTIGYIAPEYAGGGHVSTYGDVYSFGVVLLETMTGKRPTDPVFKDGVNIVSYLESSFPLQIFHVIDAHLIEECEDFDEVKPVPENALYQCLVNLLEVALSCTRSIPNERMTMKLVASKLHAIKALYVGLTSKKNARSISNSRDIN